MQFTPTLLSLFALVASTTGAPIVPGEGADPSCVPISKLTAQLTDFQKFSSLILRDAPNDFYAAKTDAINGVGSIVSPIDLLNPQVQQPQNTILADLAYVGQIFNETVQAGDSKTQVQLASEIQDILSQRLWPNAIGITALVNRIGDCSSGAKTS